jgi:hypothetical protein
MGFDRAVLAVPLGALGGPREARRLGLARALDHAGPFDVPQLDRLLADARSDRDLVVHLADSEMPGPVMFAASFPDDHPRPWRDPLHQEGELLLLATAAPFPSFSSVLEALTAAWIGRVALAVYTFGDAIGTRAT